MAISTGITLAASTILLVFHAVTIPCLISYPLRELLPIEADPKHARQPRCITEEGGNIVLQAMWKSLIVQATDSQINPQ